MVQIQTFPKTIERNLQRTMPSHALSIVHRVARDTSRKARTQDFDRQLEFAHATLHMKLYQRFGTHTSHFIAHAHRALDDLVIDKTSSGITLPLSFGRAV